MAIAKKEIINKSVYSTEHFPLITLYIDLFKKTTFSYGSNEFFNLREELLLTRDLIIDRFDGLNEETVCRFAFEYHEKTYLLNGIFTNQSDDYLYFIKGGNFIKIGRSNDPKERIQQLQVSSPERLIFIKTFYNRGLYEFPIHNIFKSIRVQGEWFNDCKKLRNYIELLTINNPELRNKMLFYGK